MTSPNIPIPRILGIGIEIIIISIIIVGVILI